MNICTRMSVTDGEAGDILDISFVEDGHRFGLSADGTELHIEATEVSVT